MLELLSRALANKATVPTGPRNKELKGYDDE